jgi:hypothetical protein
MPPTTATNALNDSGGDGSGDGSDGSASDTGDEDDDAPEETAVKKAAYRRASLLPNANEVTIDACDAARARRSLRLSHYTIRGVNHRPTRRASTTRRVRIPPLFFSSLLFF